MHGLLNYDWGARFGISSTPSIKYKSRFVDSQKGRSYHGTIFSLSKEKTYGILKVWLAHASFLNGPFSLGRLEIAGKDSKGLTALEYLSLPRTVKPSS
jgi:hypothetical protein